MKGVILAGGRGTRLMPLTENKPKCLVEVNGKPMIHYAFGQMWRGGIKEIAIICPAQYLDEVSDSLKDDVFLIRRSKAPELSLHFFPEHEPLGEAAALRLAKDFMIGKTIVSMVDCIVLGPIVERLTNASPDNPIIFAAAPWECPHTITRVSGGIRFKPMLSVVIGWLAYWGFPEYLNTAEYVHKTTPSLTVHTDFEWIDAGSHEGMRSANKLGVK